MAKATSKKKQGLPNKFKLSDEAYARLKWIKSRTSLEDWTIARLGICLSFNDPQVPDPTKYDNTANGKEFNRYTLTGEYDLLYVELLRTYMDRFCDGRDISEGELFRAHLNRGIINLSRQTKSLGDVADLLSTKASA